MLRQNAPTLDLWTGLGGWRRLLVLGGLVFLPVPTLTATGLAVPVPSLVYQVALGLAAHTEEIMVDLPGFDAVDKDAPKDSRAGVIRRSALELAAEASSQAPTINAGRPKPDRSPGEGSRKKKPSPGQSSGTADEAAPSGDQGAAVVTPAPAPRDDSPAATPPQSPTPAPPPPPPPATPPPPPPPPVTPPPPPQHGSPHGGSPAEPPGQANQSPPSSSNRPDQPPGQQRKGMPG